MPESVNNINLRHLVVNIKCFERVAALVPGLAQTYKILFEPGKI